VTVETLVDCEGSFATVHEVFPAVDSDERWVLPINCVLVRHGRRRFLGELADEEVDVIVSHFHGTGRFERSGKGFRWAVE
jgi:hypothetical protein